MKSNLVDIACKIVDDSREKAVCIADGTMEQVEADGGMKEREKWFWLPRSQVEIEEHGDGTATATMPEWLATEKGLI